MTELQKKVLEFVFKVQGIKDCQVTEKIYDFASVRKIRADLDARKWKPALPTLETNVTSVVQGLPVLKVAGHSVIRQTKRKEQRGIPD